MLALLTVLGVSVGLDRTGWEVGVGSALVVTAALTHGLRRHGMPRLGPADRVTLSRAALVVGVAALCATSAHRSVPVTALVGLSTVALVLDAVDGRVARRTGTVSSLGARFDMEVDALLILVLSSYVAPRTGWWVLAIGAARYVFVTARARVRRLQGSAPPRHWCKVVAAVQGVALTVAVAGVLPEAATTVLLAAALLLLAESFGRETWWLWRASSPAAAASPAWPVGSGVGVAADG